MIGIKINASRLIVADHLKANHLFGERVELRNAYLPFSGVGVEKLAPGTVRAERTLKRNWQSGTRGREAGEKHSGVHTVPAPHARLPLPPIPV